MKGIRVPVPENQACALAVIEAGNGSYCGPDNERRVYFRLPNGANGVFHCKEPPHKFTEEPDGTLTITASILATWGHADGDHTWHGYLTKGEWIQA